MLFSKIFSLAVVIWLASSSGNYLKSLLYAHMIYYTLYGMAVLTLNNPYDTEDNPVINIYELTSGLEGEYLNEKLFNTWDKREDYLFPLIHTLSSSDTNGFVSEMELGRENIAYMNNLLEKNRKLRWMFNVKSIHEYYFSLLYNSILFNKEDVYYEDIHFFHHNKRTLTTIK